MTITMTFRAVCVGVWLFGGAFLALGCSADGGSSGECTECLSSGGGSGTAGAGDDAGRNSDAGTPTGGGSGGQGAASDAASGGASDADLPDGGADASAWPPACQGQVDGATAKSLVERGALLIDVRTPSEFDSGHITDAINIPLGDLSARLGELDPALPIVVYCQSGSRATQAAATLCAAGYSAYNLGPMANWPS